MTNSNFATPQQAEAAFYQAFAQGDLDAMMRVWAVDEHIVCIHPGAPRLEGREAIRESWRQIFSVEAQLQFSIQDERYTQDALLAIHLVREQISIDGEVSGVMLATNVYQMVAGSWHMVLHHASPEPDPDDDEQEGESVVLH